MRANLIALLQRGQEGVTELSWAIHRDYPSGQSPVCSKLHTLELLGRGTDPYVFIPRAVPHNIANASDKPARMIVTVAPGRLGRHRRSQDVDGATPSGLRTADMRHFQRPLEDGICPAGRSGREACEAGSPGSMTHTGRSMDLEMGHHHVNIGNVKYAKASARRVTRSRPRPTSLRRYQKALGDDGVSVIACPVDYSEMGHLPRERLGRIPRS